MFHATSRDGTRIACERGGSGPPLLLVHGTTATGKRWAPVLSQLQTHFTVYAMNRRGRGESGDADAYAIEREFEDVAAVVDAIGEPVHLLGHSFGAICALEAALLAPKVGKLVLYEPPMPVTDDPAFEPRTLERLQSLLDAGDREGLLTVFFRDVNGMSQADLDKMRSLPVWAARIAVAHTLPRELQAVQHYRFDPARFAKIRAPALLLLGGDSPAYFRAAIDALQACLPDARKVVLPGQRHVAIDMVPDLFAREVLGFLSD